MNFKESLKTSLIFIILVIITFLSIQKNIFDSLPNEVYVYPYDESETIVLGGLVANKYNKKVPKNANFGFVAIGDFKYDIDHVFQAYSLIKDTVPDITLKLENINDENWSNGIARYFSGIVVKQDVHLSEYIGRDIFLQNGESRIVKMVTHANGYTNIYVTGSIISPNKIGSNIPIKLSGKAIHPETMVIIPYLSQYGIQGILFSKLYKVFPSIKGLYRINSLFFAITIALLVLIYKKIISNSFSIIFFITIITSYWIMLFANNLYWIPFSWFLPSVFSGYYAISKRKINKTLLLIAVYFSFLFKCLAGYEFISSIILFASAIFIFELFNPDRTLTKSESVKGFFIICLLGCAGFLTALLIHANMRGDTIFEGLKSIYEMDVKRRTYGNPENFSGDFSTALSSSPLTVIKTYIVDWKTEFLKFIPGYLFRILLTISAGSILYRYYKHHKNSNRDLGLFIAFLLPPLSWFVLAKAHSYIHVHINFVLWYLGFAAVLIYLFIIAIKITTIYIVSWANKTKPSEI